MDEKTELRDFLAAHIVAAFIGNHSNNAWIDMPKVAQGAYAMADEMLKARGAE